MSPLGDIFEGEQMDCYVEMGACYLKPTAGKTRRDPISSLYKSSHLGTRRTMVTYCWQMLSPTPKRLKSIVAIEKQHFQAGNFWIFIPERLSTRTKSCFGKLGEFGLNKIRSPGDLRRRGFWFYWDLSYQLLFTWTKESVSSQNGKIFIKLLPISTEKSNENRVGVARTDNVGYMQ